MLTGAIRPPARRGPRGPWDTVGHRDTGPAARTRRRSVRAGRDGTVLHVSSPQERLVAQLARIKELSGLSLRALARQAGLSSSSLSRYLTGRLVPPWEAVVALCRVVGRDPRPLRAVWAEAAKAGAAPAPRRNDLPADLFDFTGREAESALVEELLRTAGAVAIDGMAGVGKTSLAVHVAHRLAAGVSGRRALPRPAGLHPGPGAAGAAGRAGPAAGRAGDHASPGRRRRTRGALAVGAVPPAGARRARQRGRRGAGAPAAARRGEVRGPGHQPPSAGQPGRGAAGVPGATGRRRRGATCSAGRPGSAPGSPRTQAVGQVLRQCGGLPLALRMAGARLRHRPGWTVAVLAERLRDNAGRFDAVFGMSLQQLDAAQRRMFRLLGRAAGRRLRRGGGGRARRPAARPGRRGAGGAGRRPPDPGARRRAGTGCTT